MELNIQIDNTSEELNNAYENLPRPNIIICEGQQTIIYTPTNTPSV